MKKTKAEGVPINQCELKFDATSSGMFETIQPARLGEALVCSNTASEPQAPTQTSFSFGLSKIDQEMVLANSNWTVLGKWCFVRVVKCLTPVLALTTLFSRCGP